MFCAPFVLLAMRYRALPPEIPVLRVWIGHTSLAASKSLFMAFRVPLMNLLHGLMAAVMLRQAPAFANPERRAAYSRVFGTLLFTLALKSDFEAMEFAVHARWLALGTLASVLGGLALALYLGRRVPLPWPELRLPAGDKMVLVALFAAYLAIVAASLLVSHRA